MVPRCTRAGERGGPVTHSPWVPEVIYTVHPRAESIKVTFLCC